MANVQLVDPGALRLPPGRQSGPDLWRLQKQIADFGGETETMPPLLVTEGKNRELMINNGVTREEMQEVFMQAAVYCGVPAGVESFRIAREVFAELDKK